MNKDVGFMTGLMGLVVAWALMSGAVQAEAGPQSEEKMFDCVASKVRETGFWINNPTAGIEDLEATQIFAGCLKTHGYTREEWTSREGYLAPMPERSGSEVERILAEDRQWREHLRHFNHSPGLNRSMTPDEVRPRLRLERIDRPEASGVER